MIVTGSLGQHQRKLGNHEAEMASDTRRVHPPRSGLYKVLLSEALTCRNQTLKKIHMQTASHTQTPQLFGQIRIPYALHYPQPRKAFYPSPGHPVTMQQVGALVPYNADRDRTQRLMTGIPYDG